jgi:hypothetical protein
MNRTTVIRPIAATLLSAAVLAPAAPAADDEGFVLRRDPSKAVPFVLEPAPVTREEGFDWGDAALGAGAATLLLAPLGTGLTRVRRRDPELRRAAT